MTTPAASPSIKALTAAAMRLRSVLPCTGGIVSHRARKLVRMEPSRTEEVDAASAEEIGSALTDLVIITGFSGAGKSTAMAVFEDEGYFCVDNLPSEMIRSLVELFVHRGSKVARAAVVSDARGGSYFDGLAAMLDDLRAHGVS